MWGILNEDEDENIVMELKEVTAKEYELWMRKLERNMSQQDDQE
jgi:hypothetical protein